MLNFETLAPRYAGLWDSAVISGPMAAEARHMAGRMLNHRDTYRAIEQSCGVPWYVVGLIHAMESGQDFRTHLHNGDPLTSPTVHVPAHRPRARGGPFTFLESAVDALRLDGFDRVADWPIERVLYQLECFNGTGHLRNHPECLTPYLWSGTQHYRCGKYVEDGKYDPIAISQQAGAAAILRAALDIDPGIIDNAVPQGVPRAPVVTAAPTDAGSFRKAMPEDPPINSMADSTIGNVSGVVGGTGSAAVAKAAAGAFATAIKSGALTAYALATALLVDEMFWMGAIACAGSLYIWLERRRHMRAGNF